MPHCPFLLCQLEIRLGQQFLKFLWLPLLLSILPVGHKMAMAKSASSSEHFSRSAHFHRIESTAGGTGHHPSGGGAGGIIISGGGTQRLNRCYSCMSPLYEQLFKESDLGSFFYEPRNFTAQCEEPMDPRGIGLVPCRGICLSLAQQFVIMGRKTGKRLWMRGCAHSLSRHGYQNRTIAFFAEFDLCREVHASDLFRLADHSSAGSSGEYFGGGNGGGGGFMGGGGGHQSAGGPMDGQSILVCSCLGDRCNHQSSAAISANYSRLLLLLLLNFIILFSIIPLLRIAPIPNYISPLHSI